MNILCSRYTASICFGELYDTAARPYLLQDPSQQCTLIVCR